MYHSGPAYGCINSVLQTQISFFIFGFGFGYAYKYVGSDLNHLPEAALILVPMRWFSDHIFQILDPLERCSCN